MATTPNPLRLYFNRLARRLIWPRPALYFPFGMLRGRGSVFRSDYDLYISGFPRSGNSFAVKTFQFANPGLAVFSHKHLPTFIVQSARLNKPGMVVLRNPIDAAISWAIFTGGSVRGSLAYYTDFHAALLHCREDLFVVHFEDLVNDFGKVMTEFNTRWNTNYMPFEHTEENVAKCMAEIELEYLDRDGKVIEHRVPRPSDKRKRKKETYLDQINS